MDTKLLSTTIKAATLTAGMLLSSSALADVILADSVADWDAAVNNGIDKNGNLVTAGSLLDAAEQGHAATSNGIWNYKGTNGPAVGTFSGSPGFLDWNDATGLYNTGTPTIGRTNMSTNSTWSGNEHSVREWIGSGLGGELLNISGSFTSKATDIPAGPLNNGTHVYVLIDSFLLGEALLAPNLDSYSFNFENIAVFGPTTRIRFAVGPDGPFAAHPAQDFFNDGVNFTGQISMVTADVPEPLSSVLLLTGLAFLGRRRRSLLAI